MIQKPKQRVDVGIVGNPSTGDILYDGGVKLNDNIDSMYNTFGDARLFSSTGEGEGVQILHATGYYQKFSRQYYTANPIDIGSMHDIDTSGGALTVTLPNAKLGEGVVFINSNGSISVANSLIVRAQAGETILGTDGTLTVTSASVKITIWCTKIEGSERYWEYGVEQLFGDTTTPVEKTVQVGSASPVNVRIAGRSEYVGIKLLIAAKTVAGDKLKTSETLLTVDTTKNNILNTEYAVLKNTASEVCEIRYFVGAGDNIYAEVKSLEGNIRVAFKATDTIRIGTAT